MKSLQAIVIVALGLVLFSSCSRGYGCPYGALNQKELTPAPVEKVIPIESHTATTETIAIAR